MKRTSVLSDFVLVLLILSIVGVGCFALRDVLRTPTDYWYLAHEQIAAENYPLAARYLTRAADKGLPQAQFALATMYDVGDKIPENKELAKKYMAMAVQSDYPPALYAMGVWMERGYYGHPDMDQVVNLYQRSAERGYVNAMKSLIVLYSTENPEGKAYWYHELMKGI